MTLKMMKLSPSASPFVQPKPGDVGYDMKANVGYGGRIVVPVRERRLIPTGIAVAIPEGFYGQVAPRSGLALKHGIVVLGGVIDPSYRGDVAVMLLNSGGEPFYVEHGDRIAQLIIQQVATPLIELVDDLDDTWRGGAGFGSTGVKEGVV
jgi:dUTP pyrophosphatase